MTRSELSSARARLLAALRERAAQWSPLTATQQGIWLAEQLEPGVSGYHDTAALRVDGSLDPDVLRGALGDLQAGHEALRARVVDMDGEPRQRFDVDRVDWALVDLARVPTQARQARLDRLLAVAAAEPFDLAAGPLWRARLVRLAAEEHVLVLVVHHLIADGWSHGVLLESLLACHAARRAGVAAPPGRRGYAAWLAGRVRRERETGAASAVAASLRAAPYRLRLSGFDPDPPDRVAAESTVPLDTAGWAAFDTVCRRAGTTRFMALTGLFGLTLARAGGRDGVLLTAPVAGRYDAVTARLLGCLITVVPLDVHVTARDTAGAAVAAGTSAAGRALRHPDLPYREIVRAAGPLPPGDDPLTNVGIEEFNAPTGEISLGALRVAPLPRAQLRLRHDLTLSVPSGSGDPATLLYPRARWSPDRVADLAGDLAGLIVAATAELTS